MDQSHIFNQLLIQMEKLILGPVSEKLFTEPKEEKSGLSISNPSLELHKATSIFNYLSTEHPIIGNSTDERDDVEITRQLFRLNHASSEITNYLTYEILVKVLAYRNLSIGDELKSRFFWAVKSSPLPL